MYGQMTAGSWIYIGTQGILQGTYETFAAVAAKRFGGTLAGTLTLTAGLGGMGGAQPLAVTMNGGRGDLHRLRPVPHRPPASSTATSTSPPTTPTTRCRRAAAAAQPGQPLSIGLLGNAADLVPGMLRDGRAGRHRDRPDLGARPADLPAARRGVRGLAALRAEDPAGFTRRARESMAAHVEAMVGFMDAGAEVFDYGNSIRGEAELGGYDRAFAFPGSCPPTSGRCSAKARGRSAGRPCPATRRTSRPPTGRYSTCSPTTSSWPGGSGWPGRRSHFQGLPARICWLGYGERDKAGLRFNDMVARGEVAGPDRDRPRSPRLRVGRLAVPGDRGDGRRLRRHRRLAAAERPGQHGLGRVLGVDPPRRRRRDRPLDPRRPGLRRRRQPDWRHASWSGCSPTTRAWACSATSTPATSGLARWPRSAASASRCGSTARETGTIP